MFKKVRLQSRSNVTDYNRLASIRVSGRSYSSFGWAALIGDDKSKEANCSVFNISNTARWVSHFCTCETEQAYVPFWDRYARQFAGAHGFEIAKMLLDGKEWEIVAPKNTGRDGRMPSSMGTV
jgi:hypothetical protein